MNDYINIDLAYTLIKEQFSEYSHLNIKSVEKQGHDNRTYKIGNDLLIRIPTAESYALKVPIEQELLPKLTNYITTPIPIPIKMGIPSDNYSFSIYKWLDGKSLNQISINNKELETLASDLANFLKELQNIRDVTGPKPGQHNWWRGDHISVYDNGTREQIKNLKNIININSALTLWEKACSTKWQEKDIWIHGDMAKGNILMKNYKLSGVIDFGGMAVGDPACDLTIAWTLFEGESRRIFIRKMGHDNDTWLRAKAWCLWKATYELNNIKDKKSSLALAQINIINQIVN